MLFEEGAFALAELISHSMPAFRDVRTAVESKDIEVRLPLFPLHMTNILLVLKAHVLHQLSRSHQLPAQLYGPGLGVRLQIVHGDLDFHRSEIRTAEALGEFSLVGQRAAKIIRPQ